MRDRARAKLGDKVRIPAVVEKIEYVTMGETRYKVEPITTWFDADEIEALGQTESEGDAETLWEKGMRSFDGLEKVLYKIQGDAETATTTEVDYCNNCPYLPWGKDCISRADTIKGICAECWWKDDCRSDCVEVAAIKGVPPVNQKQVTSKLESAENATSEGEESTMGQPKSKLDCISRQAVIELIKESYYDLSEMDDVWVFVADIENLPPVTPTERTGEWVQGDQDKLRGVQYCTSCGAKVDRYSANVWHFCPNCGAKMGGDTE